MHVLITSGPTREYFDAVRYITNASSGRMGRALAEAALQAGWQVTVVTGPAPVEPPQQAKVVRVVSASQMYQACLDLWPQVDGIIAAAAVADFRPQCCLAGKISRSNGPLTIKLEPNPDILAELGRAKGRRWSVGFALELDGQLQRARTKLQQKRCDAIVLNESTAMESAETALTLLDATGSIAFRFRGTKQAAANKIVDWIDKHLCFRQRP